jgi:multiple sugar transport system ATP-binding protein
MSSIRLRGLTKIYPTGVVAVDNLDLDVDEGEIVVLLGPTGCGKTTVLRLIAGLDSPTAGDITFAGHEVDRIAPRDRGVAMVFQEYALYPHLSVAENISFPLMHLPEADRTARLREVVRMLGLETLMHKRPGQLSGGQRQRVAMARAVARPPSAFLLDQPLSSLDAAARDGVRADILDLVHRLGVATVYVTHDHVEAMCLADRVAVMRQGRIEQLGTPEQIYGDPQRLFVAAFVGSPRMNLLQAAVYAEPEVRTVIDLGTQTLELPWEDPRARALAEYHTSRITVGVRPDAFAAAEPGAANGLAGTVRMVELLGHDALVRLETGCARTPNLVSHLELPDAPGDLTNASTEVPPSVHPVRDRLLRLVSQPPRRPEERYALQPSYEAANDIARQALGDLSLRVDAAQAPRIGQVMTVAVDVNQLYLFDGAANESGYPPPPRLRPWPHLPNIPVTRTGGTP